MVRAKRTKGKQMKSSQNEKLIYSMITALTLEWSDNGNIMADAVRDMCVQVVAESTGKSFNEVQELIDARAEELQG